MLRQTILAVLCWCTIPILWIDGGLSAQPSSAERTKEPEYDRSLQGGRFLNEAERGQRLRAIRAALSGNDPIPQDAAIALLAVMGDPLSPADDQSDARKMTAPLLGLIKQLSDSERKVAALRALGKLNPAPSDLESHLPVRAVVEALSSSDLMIRRAAAEALRDMFVDAGKPSIRPLDLLNMNFSGSELPPTTIGLGLVPAMTGIGWEIKWGEWYELTLLFHSAEEGFHRALRDPDPIVSRAGAQAVAMAARSLVEAQENQPIKDLVKTGGGGDFGIGGGRSTDPDLIKLRTHWAVLVQLNEVLARVVPELQPLSNSPRPEIRKAASNALIQLGLVTSASRHNVRLFQQLPVDLWYDFLQGDQPFEQLPPLPDPTPKDEPEFLKPETGLLTTPQTPDRRDRLVVQDDTESLPLPRPRPRGRKADGSPDRLQMNLIETLRQGSNKASDPSPEIRLEYMTAIESLMEAAFPLADILVVGMRDPNPFVRWTAARSAGRFAPKQAEIAVPGLAPMALDQDLGARRAALLSLRSFGTDAQGASASVAASIRFGDDDLRVQAVRTITTIEPDISRLLDVLIPATVQPDEPGVQTHTGVRLESVRAIGQMALDRKDGLGEHTPRAIEALRRVLDDPDENVRATAAEVILLLGT